MKTSAVIPGISDLLIPGVQNPNAELRIAAINNALLPITFGIGAIGALISAIDHDKGVPDGTLEDAGYLLSFLSELTSSLQQIMEAAVYEQVHGHALEVAA